VPTSFDGGRSKSLVVNGKLSVISGDGSGIFWGIHMGISIVGRGLSSQRWKEPVAMGIEQLL
jgi:hypothetical protein